MGGVLLVAFWALLIYLWGRWELFMPQDLPQDDDYDIYR